MPDRAISSAEVRRANRHRVLRLLSRHGAMARADLCRESGLTGAGLSRIARELIDAGLLREVSARAPAGSVGRPGASLAIRPDGAFVIGMAISANRNAVVLMDAGQTLWEEEEVSVSFTEPEAALQTFADAANRLARRCGIDRNRLIGIGLCIGAPAARAVSAEGYVTSPVLGWADVPVGPRIAAATGLPTRVVARAAALLQAEIQSAPQAQHESRFLINAGLGIGSASDFPGNAQGSAIAGLGCVSHLPCPGSDVVCACGRRGCLEQTAAGAAVVRLLDPLLDRPGLPFAALNPALHQALDRAAEGDPAARAAFRTAGQRMAHGVDAVAALLGPDRIILAGQTGRQPDYLAGVRQGLSALASPVAGNTLSVSTAKSAEAAACVALENFVFSRQVDIARLKAA
ncbi:MAG: ROK family transcriptional regulator [Pseudomonadota bacterium]